MDPILERYQALEDKVAAYTPNLDTKRLFDAFTYADTEHHGQLRKSGEPYIIHPLAVAQIVAEELRLDSESIEAALLHDVIEDTAATHEQVSKLFSPTIADLVEGVSKLTRIQYATKEDEQMENLRKMLIAMSKDIRVILIKISDRLHNMRTMEYQSPAKQKQKSLETMEIYAPIAHRLGLFNDGMLGSASDLGTYGTTTREEELAFQNRLCRFVPNGGEVVHDTPFSALMAAVPYLKTIHVSYLNADYDPTVLQKWSRTIWNAEDAFSGCDGLTYVQAHLGYRYTARAFTLQKQGVLSPRLTFRLTLENTGFSNALRPLTGAFLLRNARTGETRRAPVAFDFRTLTSGQAQTLTASLPAGELPRGSWQIFFSVTDDATGRQIALGNTTFVEGSGVLLGRVDCSGAFQEGG